MKGKFRFGKLPILAIFALLMPFAQAGEVCQYAVSAEATSEISGHEAKYAIGTPDSDGHCGTAPKAKVSWEKESWNATSQIELTFKDEVYPGTLDIYGDYELCISKIWFLRENDWYLADKGVLEKGLDSNCTISYDFGAFDFKTRKVKIQPCAWTWSAIDAVRFCGSQESFPKIALVSPVQDAIIDPKGNNFSLVISTDIVSECEIGFSKEFGFGEGAKMETRDGLAHFYKMDKPAEMSEFSAYYKCRGKNGKTSPYSVAHRFSVRASDAPFVQICNWQNCLEAAASISDDDGYHTTIGRAEAVCSGELEKRGLYGTYFLAYTDKYSDSDWEIFRKAYEYGHEIGGHSRSHTCRYDLNETFFREDNEKNREDIIREIGLPEEELMTFAWPCGATNSNYKQWISDYYLFARGYYKNLMGSKNPVDRLEYKSINSIGFGPQTVDYYIIADTAKNHQDWINYVYHDSCDNPEIFDYLIEKGFWIDTIGSVSKYIMQRNAAGIENVSRFEGGMEFDVVSALDEGVFDKDIALMIFPGNETLEKILVNGKRVETSTLTIGERPYIRFNVPPGKSSHVEVIGIAPVAPLCGDGKVNLGREECDDGNALDGDGCSKTCKIEGESKIYIISYVGNIDGNADKSWYYFFDNITSYYEINRIPVAFSFFPDSIRQNNYEFSQIFRRIYLAENIELMQKGYRMDDYEKRLEELDPSVQKHIIESGRHDYLYKMEEILGRGIEGIDFPVTYVAPYGRMTPEIRRALEEMGFRVSFGVYYVDGLGPVESTANIDLYQYAVSFTRDGSAGRNTTFKSPDEIIAQVLSYERVDLPTIKINGKMVVPLYVHQPDFEHPSNNSVLDAEKWKIYTETIERLRENPNVTFITPSGAWKLRHPACIPTGFSEKSCNRIDDDCDGMVDEECSYLDYARNFSFEEYNLSYSHKEVDMNHYRDYFEKDSLMDKMAQFIYTLYDWAAYSANDWKNRVFSIFGFL